MTVTDNAADAAVEKLRSRLPEKVCAFIWFDARDNVWRGLVREFSLFAEGNSDADVVATLKELMGEYISDAVEHGLVEEMIPRPVPRAEWFKLMAYGKWLGFLSFILRAAHRERNGNHPVQHRLIPC